MNRFLVELDLECDWTPEDLRDAILDGMGFPINVEKEPHRVTVKPAPLESTGQSPP